MASLPQDLLTIILAKLPLKRITTSKLVCKQWKSILESKYFYQLFQSYHKNSHSSWSLMYRKSHEEVMAHYGCNNWGLTGSLGSYISSFVTSLCHTEGLHGHRKESVRVEAYSDVGLILVSFTNLNAWCKTYYVANPISREYVKIPPVIPSTNWITISKLVTQVENDIVLSYKIVLIKYMWSLLIYSSETCLWSCKTILSPLCYTTLHPISLNENFYWIGRDDTLQKFVLVYFNFYSTGMDSDRCRVIHFPGEEKKHKFRRVCATSEGSLMYIKIVSEDKDDDSVAHELSVWRLKSGEWQSVSEISLGFTIPGFVHAQYLTINPFDAKIVYFWSNEQKRLASINLDNGKIELHNNFDCRSEGCNHVISEEWDLKEGFIRLQHCMVVLPRWLYRIP